MHEDGAALRTGVTESRTIPLPPDLWEKVCAASQAEAIAPPVMAVAAFALLLERLARGVVGLEVVSRGGGSTSLAIGLTTEPDFGLAARKIAQALKAAASESGGPAHPYAFILDDGDPPAVAGPSPDWKLALTLRPPQAEAPGALLLDFDSGCFSPARAESLLRAYARLLRATAEQPRSACAAFALAPAHERICHAPRRPNGAPTALNAGVTRLDQLFDAICRRWPEAPAAAWQGGGMSFAELDRAGQAVAQALRTAGARAGDIIALRLRPGTSGSAGAVYFAAQIAAFRLGCAIMPLGQRSELAQAAHLLERLSVRFLIDAVSALDLTPNWIGSATCVPIDGFSEATLFIGPSEGPQWTDGAAFVLTTSGSTGAPKAIRLSHENLVGFIRAMEANGFFPAEPSLMGTNIGFDVVIADIWLAWTYGRHVVVLDTERRPPKELRRANALGARVMSASPTLAGLALAEDADCFAGFHSLFLVGEILPRALANRLGEALPHLAVVNGYGPSEMAVLSTICRVAPHDEGSAPIGWALDGYTILIACPDTGGPLPPHWTGELLIACAAPALGYADAAMTAARFLAIPGETAGPFFRVGDFGWTDEQGQARFIGRGDRQHKIAGIRIELDGIEHVVSQAPGVDEVAALVTGPEFARRVAAVIKPAQGVADLAALRDAILSHCRAWLPQAAIPSRIKFVEDMPTGASGKKSHAALRDLLAQEDSANAERGGLPAPGSMEEQIAAFWQARFAGDQRRVEAIHRDDDVFALGATSLDAVAVIEDMEEAFGVRLDDELIFVRPSMAGQAQAVRAAASEESAAAPADGQGVVIEFRTVRAAQTPGASQGLVLCLPGFDGGAYFAGIMAAEGFESFDIVVASCDLGGRVMDEIELPFAIAEALCEAILRGDIARPRVLVGFSISGWLAWLVERNLVARGAAPIPIVNFDGGPLHLFYEHWRGEAYRLWKEKAAALMAQASGGPRAEMLFLNVARWRWCSKIDFHLATEWQQLGVDLYSVRLRSLVHMDAHSLEAVRAMRGRMNAFALGLRDRAALGQDITLDGPRPTALDLAETPSNADAAAVRALVAALPATPVDEEMRQPLLFLAMVSGDGDLALSVARRLIEESAVRWYAPYAEVAILAAMGQREKALDRAEYWNSHFGESVFTQRLQNPVAPAPAEQDPPDTPWAFECLDYAAGFIARATQEAAADSTVLSNSD